MYITNYKRLNKLVTKHFLGSSLPLPGKILVVLNYHKGLSKCIFRRKIEKLFVYDTVYMECY